MEQRDYGWAMIIPPTTGKPREHAQAGCGQAFDYWPQTCAKGPAAAPRPGREVIVDRDRLRPCPIAAHCALSSSMCVPAARGGFDTWPWPLTRPLRSTPKNNSFTEAADDVAFAL